MQIAGLSYSSAPQTMAQTIGLPGAGDNKHSVTEIQPILDARRPETKLGSADSPLAFWNAVRGEPDPETHTPPPSIMQIKISQILQDQALGQTDEATEDVATHENTGQSDAIDKNEDAARTRLSEDTEDAPEPTKGTQKEYKADATPERVPMIMPLKLPQASPSEQTGNATNVPAAYEEAANISRKDLLSIAEHAQGNKR